MTLLPRESQSLKEIKGEETEEPVAKSAKITASTSGTVEKVGGKGQSKGKIKGKSVRR